MKSVQVFFAVKYATDEKETIKLADASIIQEMYGTSDILKKLKKRLIDRISCITKDTKINNDLSNLLWSA